MRERAEQIDPGTLLDDETRQSRLALHVGRLVQRGAELEMLHGVRAIVVRSRPKHYLVNAALAAAGVAGFAAAGEPLFLLGAGVAALGWHRKLVSGAERVRSVIRVDEVGRITEQVIEAA